MEKIYFIFFVIIIFGGLFLVLRFFKGKKLNNQEKALIKKNLRKILLSNSSKEKVIDFDKLYHNVLKQIGYKGTFGEILKKEPKEIKDLNKIWELHKIRNKLVHDFDSLSDNILKTKSKEYEFEIKKLLSILE